MDQWQSWFAFGQVIANAVRWARPDPSLVDTGTSPEVEEGWFRAP